MNSIKEVIKASKSAHALPHNQLTTGMLCFVWHPLSGTMYGIEGRMFIIDHNP